MPGMPGPGGGGAKVAAKVDANANASLEFVLECRRTDDPEPSQS